MGRVLAGILSSGIEARTSDDRDRSAVLLEAATAATLDTPGVEALIADDAPAELPPETTVRRLVEALEVEDVDAVIAQARADGDIFEGDEVEGEHVVGGGALRIVEAMGDGAAPGTRRYKVVVIRPGRAQGHGRRFYPTRMLEANAANFGGQPMFWNHDDLDTILKRGHGSRDPRDLCGWLQESTWFDPDYTDPDDAAKKRLKGAVMGIADLDEAAADSVDKFPQALGLSVDMDSTKIAVGRAETGELCPLVEGVIKGSGSCDLITGEAGAGGRVLERLRESATGDGHERLRDAAKLRYGSPNADLSVIDDDRLIEAVRARAGLVDRLREEPPAPRDPEDDPVDELTPERIVEALETPEGAAALDRIVEARVDSRVAEREEGIRAEATADSNRTLDLRDMRDEAVRLIESRSNERGGILTPAFVSDLRERYQLRDGRHPSPALDVHDEIGEDGTTVVKTARERLVESVTADIEREEGKLREAAPTRVRELAQPREPGAPDPPEGDPPKVEDPLADELGVDADKVRSYQEAR